MVNILKLADITAVTAMNSNVTLVHPCYPVVSSCKTEFMKHHTCLNSQIDK